MTEPAIARRAFDGDQPTGIVGFTAMADGTKEDYELLDRYERLHVGQLPNRLMETLDGLTNSLGGYQITRLEHSLQAATRARLAGADVNWVVAALLHDIGDELAPYNHSELAASVLSLSGILTRTTRSFTLQRRALRPIKGPMRIFSTGKRRSTP